MSLFSYLFIDSSYKYYYKYKKCYSCKLEKKVYEQQPYIYKIKGIGKLHNQFICHDCLQLKIINNYYNN